MAAFLFLHLFCIYIYMQRIYIENVLFFSLVALTLKKDGA